MSLWYSVQATLQSGFLNKPWKGGPTMLLTFLSIQIDTVNLEQGRWKEYKIGPII